MCCLFVRNIKNNVHNTLSQSIQTPFLRVLATNIKNTHSQSTTPIFGVQFQQTQVDGVKSD